MSRIRSHKTEAIVLRQIPLGEADRILTLYTPDIGKVRAVAKGVRRSRSRLGGHLDLLSNVSLSLAEGRDLDIVTEAQGIRSFKGFRDELKRVSEAIYIAELVDGFSTERSGNHALYQLLVETLRWLEGPEPSDLLLRYFEIHLVGLSGFRPELRRCVECRSGLEPGDHIFDCSRGGVVCPDCGAVSSHASIPLSLNAMKVLRFLQGEEEYSKVESLRVTQRVRDEVERLLRTYVRYLMERDIRSADFMALVASEAAGGKDNWYKGARPRRPEGASREDR